MNPTNTNTEELEKTPSTLEENLDSTAPQAVNEDYIQQDFLHKSQGDIGQDYSVSDKRMIEHNINTTALAYIGEFLGSNFGTLHDAIKELNNRGYNLGVVPTKSEFGKYSIEIQILEVTASKKFNINLNTSISIEQD